jgi:hypothetical protein
VLQVLSFPYDGDKVVHIGTENLDINPLNIMVTLDDPPLLADYEMARADESSEKKVIEGVRTICASRRFGLLKNAL